MNSKKEIVSNIKMILCIVISFLELDIGLRYLTYNDYPFYSYLRFSPLGFSLSWIILLIGLMLFLSKRAKKIVYIIFLFISCLLTYSQYLHFEIMGRFYSINDIFLLKEASNYLDYAIEKTDLSILIVLIISLLTAVLTILTINRTKEYKKDKLDKIFIIGMTIILSIGFRVSAYINLGQVEEGDGYGASMSGKAAYQEFTDPSKTLQVAGLYENFYRGIYRYITEKITDNTEEQEEQIEEYLKENNKTIIPNEYTGIFKDKNIIYILMESIDSFLINEKVMPTLYTLQQEGLNFTNKYTPFFGGGQTINTEFAVNTGLYSPNNENIYSLNNTYQTSLANMLKKNGYSAVSLHFNNGFYYNRKNFHQNLGYTNHYALSDMQIDNDKYNYEYDSNLIKSDKVYELISREDKFLTFITTYSTHLPYNETNPRCQNQPYNLKGPNVELTCIYNLARDTDEMIKLLIERLEKEKKLDDTVLVFVTDHYLYGYSQITEIKNENNEYLLQNTPFIIWSNQIEHQDIDILLDSADILPTLLNMLGIDYDPNLYIGEDVFYQNRKDYIYFNEDTYYDGENFYDIKSKSGSTTIYQEIKNTIQFNNNLISTNYLKE